jgi:hypothetical protein
MQPTLQENRQLDKFFRQVFERSKLVHRLAYNGGVVAFKMGIGRAAEGFSIFDSFSRLEG